MIRQWIYVFFAVETPNYEIGQQYWYHWNLQVLTNVMVQVSSLRIVWFSRYNNTLAHLCWSQVNNMTYCVA